MSIAILSFATYACKSDKKEAEEIRKDSEAATAVVEQAQQVDPGFRVLSEMDEFLAIQIIYPTLESDKLTAEIEKMAVEYRDDVLEIYDEEEHRSMGLKWKYEVDIKYRRFTFDSRLVSFLFTGSIYTGGAHPNPVVRGMAFDLENERELSVLDLFQEKEEGLRYLSAGAIKQIGRRLNSADMSWLNEGAAPKAENFEQFTLGTDSLTIYFPPYQVAPYSEGTQKASFSYNELYSLLNPDLF
jgi:hypothetical protein